MVGDKTTVQRMLICNICGKPYNSPIIKIKGYECELIEDELNGCSDTVGVCINCKELGYKNKDYNCSNECT